MTETIFRSAAVTNRIVVSGSPSWGASVTLGTDDGSARLQTNDNVTVLATFTTAHASGTPSEYLIGANFGFTLADFNDDPDATIDGIEVHVERWNGTSQTGLFVERSGGGYWLSKDGGTTRSSSALSDGGAAWPLTATYATIGGSTSLWGEAWTVADITATTFAAVLQCEIAQVPGGNRQVRADHLEVKVYFTSGGAPPAGMTVSRLIVI